MSHRPGTPTVLRSQSRSQLLRDCRVYVNLLEMLLGLQQSVQDHFTHLRTLQEEQSHTGAICEHEDQLNDLIRVMINLMWSEAVSGLGLQETLPVLNSRAAVGGIQRVNSSSQPYRPTPQQSESGATLVSQDLSSRGIDIAASFQSGFQDYQAYQRDKYHKDKNSMGFINLGTSENKLCIDLMTERLCQSDMNHIEEVLLQYPDWRGHPFLREEVARFLTYYCKAPASLNPDNVVILNGCCSVFSALAMVLCDPGDAFLIPTPFYGGFIFSSYLYAKVELIGVHLESEITEENTSPFQLTVKKLEQAMVEARLRGKRVKGLVLVNPQNPLGGIYSQESLKEYLEFAKRNYLHVIMDEIYMLTVFDDSLKFHSVLSIESLPDPNRTHVIWGTSKDFGISGFRFGALYTHNKDVASAMCSFGYLHSTSGTAQYKLHRLLQDTEWINTVYLPTNLSRLRKAYNYVTGQLKLLGIPFLSGGAGLYIWINLKSYLEPCTFDEELALHQHFLDMKVMLSRGKSFKCKEPGWFRLMFAEKLPTLEVAMQRLHNALQIQKQIQEQKQIEKMLADASVS
ncbi:probable inactive 1-aminocyclopropane-1-carboxylate synthase-like protein 2 [Ochotona princeps]|uniref:probable inactive 1-aminocyclopropane-1-carboxylate synthase-like protein 2 n=1 Tax=Ochotona princeps TaxID=9978 RepID=UPI0027147673|nr:probable inactive 1-aminocyclopropane-1-carboxylate synthase-like protein 2 [Ochotona princeps]